MTVEGAQFESVSAMAPAMFDVPWWVRETDCVSRAFRACVRSGYIVRAQRNQPQLGVFLRCH